MNHDNATKNSAMMAYKGTGAEAIDYLAQHCDIMYIHHKINLHFILTLYA